MEGRKDDGGKLRYDLIPSEALDALAFVYTVGAKKYDDNNWAKGMKWGRVFGAMMRHGWKWVRGESIDPEDGQHHLASVAWCAFTLFMYELKKVGEDDRLFHAFEPTEPKVEFWREARANITCSCGHSQADHRTFQSLHPCYRASCTCKNFAPPPPPLFKRDPSK